MDSKNSDQPAYTVQSIPGRPCQLTESLDSYSIIVVLENHWILLTQVLETLYQSIVKTLIKLCSFKG